MQNILVLGAGRSTTTLINYLYKSSVEHNWKLVIADFNKEFLLHKAEGKKDIVTEVLDIFNEEQRRRLIAACDLCISMLPASLHYLPAQDCLDLNKHFINASYITPRLEGIYRKGMEGGKIFMGELGLDPGLDHLSAMKVLDETKEAGGKIISFRSFAGGLVAPQYDDNPWNYKFSWNPRNVVVAGQGIAQYKKAGRSFFTPYSRLFAEPKSIAIDQVGHFGWYPNRDSMSYITRYGLEACPTVIRGTLRKPGYCESWNCLVQLGLTDDITNLTGMNKLSYREWLAGIIHLDDPRSLEAGLAQYLNIDIDGEEMNRLRYIDLLSDKKIALSEGSSAQIIEHLLKDKWRLKEGETDLIVMKHEIEYVKSSKKFLHESVLYFEGKDEVDTAMAQLVGLPLAIMAEFIMIEKLVKNRYLIPIEKKIYIPILEKLDELGVRFKETVREL